MHKTHERALEALSRRGRHRALAPAAGIDFASNDYLGLGQHPEVVEAFLAEIETAGEEHELDPTQHAALHVRTLLGARAAQD